MGENYSYGCGVRVKTVHYSHANCNSPSNFLRVMVVSLDDWPMGEHYCYFHHDSWNLYIRSKLWGGSAIISFLVIASCSLVQGYLYYAKNGFQGEYKRKEHVHVATGLKGRQLHRCTGARSPSTIFCGYKWSKIRSGYDNEHIIEQQ